MIYFGNPWTSVHWITLCLATIFATALICLVCYYSKRETIIEHCEAQHAALMRGDDQLGIYGEYPPADACGGTLMNDLRRDDYDIESPEDLPTNLNRLDRGLSWTCRDGNKYTWMGNYYQNT